MRISIYISIFLVCLSCSTNQVKKKITGMWVVDKVIIGNKSYAKGAGVLLINLMVLNENNKCRLPGQYYSKEEAHGTWDVYKENGEFFLKIENCNDEFFNNDYKIEFKDENCARISFVSKRISFYCSHVVL